VGPFDRFNDRAKRVLALSQDEAIRFNHNYIGPEHLLLGLVREGEGIAARVLDSFNVLLSPLRAKVEERIGRGDSTQSPSEIVLSPGVKKIIDRAIQEIRTLGHSHVGTEHLLLGVLDVTDGPAASILTELGVALTDVRARVMQQFGNPTFIPPPTAQGAPTGDMFGRFDDHAKRVLALAQNEAVLLRHNYIGTEHLLLGLLRDDDNVAAGVLRGLGVGLSRARAGVHYIIGPGNEPTNPTDITLSPRTKKVVEFAMDEARRLGHSRVAPEHILLGLVREGEGIASGIIESAGVSLEQVRQQLISAMGRPDMDR
jgi:ATP-dependent Clp protease ATP-binding subunit ClpA